jgi:predicted DNA-binding antitoxin AbrB/MazE fold protein
MSVVDAVYANGTFHPVSPVDLPENLRVRLTVEVAQKMSMAEWLELTQKLRDEQVAKYGVFPDSTPDIAADRRRDV